MNELVIKNKQVAAIEFDKEKALKDAMDIMSKYEGLQFQEEDLKSAKTELATLRKVAKEINAQALALDKELTNPVKVFRSDVKEVVGVINKGIADIDAQVKTFESKQKEVRKSIIMSWVEYEMISEYIPFNDDWLLKKWNDDKLKDLLNTHHDQITTYVSTIKMTSKTLGLESEFYINKLKTTPYAEVIELMNTVAQAKEPKVEVQPVIVDENETLLTINRQITGTRTQLKALKKYALEIGCKYGAVGTN